MSNDIIRFLPFCSNEKMRFPYVLIISSECDKSRWSLHISISKFFIYRIPKEWNWQVFKTCNSRKTKPSLIENEIGINCSKHSQCWHCQKGWGIAQIVVTKACCSSDTKLNVSKTFILSIIIIYHGFTTSFERLLSWFCCFISKLFD